MKIWLIQIGEPIPVNQSVRKQRLTMLSEELARRGHKVVRFGSRFDHVTKTMLSVSEKKYLDGNLSIKLMKGTGYKKNISFMRIIDHWIVKYKILKVLKKNKSYPELILVCTPIHTLASDIVKYARIIKVPVVLDIRDQWPDNFFEQLPNFISPFFPLLFWRDIRSISNACKNATALTSMMEELLEWGLRYGKRKKSKLDQVFYLGSDRSEKAIETETIPLIENVLKKIHGKFVFAFAGTFSNFYDPTIIVKAFRRIACRKDTALIIVGDGNKKDSVGQEIADVENAYMLGWLTSFQIERVLGRAHVGILPAMERRPSFPNKAFMYLSAHMPIISSAVGELECWLEREQLGLQFEIGDINSLENSMLKLLENRNLYDEMRVNVVANFNKHFNASCVYTKFAAHLEMVAQCYKEI